MLRLLLALSLLTLSCASQVVLNPSQSENNGRQKVLLPPEKAVEGQRPVLGPPSPLVLAVNLYRRGLSPLIEDKGLDCAASKLALDLGLRGACAHTDSSGGGLGERLKGCQVEGPEVVTEIVACDLDPRTSASGVVEVVAQNLENKTVLLNPEVKSLGVAHFNGTHVLILR